MKSIFDATFRYTPSYSTDLKKTFARVRQERRRAEQSPEPSGSGATVTRLQIDPKRRVTGKASGTRP
jgi:hypothetical protein